MSSPLTAEIELPAGTPFDAALAEGESLAIELAELVRGDLAAQLREGGINWDPPSAETMARKRRVGAPHPERPGYATGSFANAVGNVPITLTVERFADHAVVDAYLTPGPGPTKRYGDEDVYLGPTKPGSMTQFQGQFHDFFEGRGPEGKRRGRQPARTPQASPTLERAAQDLVEGEGPRSMVSVMRGEGWL